MSEDQAINYDHRAPIDNPDHPYEITHKVDLFLKAVVEKSGVVTLSADKTTIVANGIDEAVITCTGLVEATVIKISSVGEVAVTVADNTVHFTTDTAGRFNVKLKMTADQYSLDTLTIVAT